MKYRIVRMFQDCQPPAVVKRGLSLEDAQAHCHDPETSSQTCTSKEGRARTEAFGPWFDGYEEERKRR